MSIAINSNFERDQYQAAAGQTVFNFSFPIFSETYLKVYRRLYAEAPNDADDLLTLGTDYTVVGVDEEAGGFITLVVACVANEIITLVGEEPIERESVFQDLNPFTVALNQQLNEQTVMQQQTYTYWNHVTPRYYFSELVSDEVRPLKRILPMLPNGHVWMGRGEIGENPDDIVTVALGDFDALGLLDVDYVIGHPNPALPNAQPLVNLNNGIMINIDGTVNTSIIEAGPGIIVTNGDGQDPGAPIIISADGGGGSVEQVIPQVGHGLSKYQWVRPTATPPLPHYVTAQATSDVNAEVMGIVTDASDADEFTLQQAGFLGDMDDHPLFPFTPGVAYFLSDTVAGAMQTADVTTIDYVTKPVFVADRTNGGWVIPQQRGKINASDSGGGTVITDTNKQLVTQVNDFLIGELLRIYDDAGTGKYERAIASSFTDAQSVVMVVEINVDGDPDKFVVQSEGWVDVLSGRTIETLYYLSPTVAGAMTTTRPTDPSYYIKPIFVAISASSGWLLEQQQLPVAVADSQNITKITQVAHGFAVKDVVRVDNAGTSYIKAIATSIQNATTAGIVIKVIDANNFVIQQSGETSLITGMTPGQRYWLSATVAGALTATEPTTAGQVSKLMYVARLAAQGQIQEQRPMLQPNANGGGGGGGGGYVLIGSTTFVGGETEWETGDIFVAPYTTFKIVFDEVYFSANTVYFHMRAGYGVGPTYDDDLHYTLATGGVGGSDPAYDSIRIFTVTIPASGARGPLSGSMETNNLGSSATEYEKKFYNWSGAVRDIGFGVNSSAWLSINASGYCWVWTPPALVEWDPITSLKFYPNNGTFISGSIRIYGME